ncbi:hypothetical protein NDU88_010172 [Pleurodeles waltl]|uniref:Uncharacterized protein n=1 Tax=Pleurodeles waltl TaxID=8319 RepID=A0AAV7S2H9_PLEWA|nr:hypothetical protein NDU88_010172 [Pleurodeles waltl]
MTRHCFMQESETVRQRHVLKKKQRENTVTPFAAEQDVAEQVKKRRPEENPLHQMQAERPDFADSVTSTGRCKNKQKGPGFAA